MKVPSVVGAFEDGVPHPCCVLSLGSQSCLSYWQQTGQEGLPTHRNLPQGVTRLIPAIPLQFCTQGGRAKDTPAVPFPGKVALMAR